VEIESRAWGDFTLSFTVSHSSLHRTRIRSHSAEPQELAATVIATTAAIAAAVLRLPSQQCEADPRFECGSAVRMPVQCFIYHLDSLLKAIFADVCAFQLCEESWWSVGVQRPLKPNLLYIFWAITLASYLSAGCDVSSCWLSSGAVAKSAGVDSFGRIRFG